MFGELLRDVWRECRKSGRDPYVPPMSVNFTGFSVPVLHFSGTNFRKTSKTTVFSQYLTGQ